LAGLALDHERQAVAGEVAGRLRVLHRHGAHVGNRRRGRQQAECKEDRKRASHQPVAIGRSWRPPPSAHEPSPTPTSERPGRASASATTEAVTPEPQLVATGAVTSTPAVLKMSASAALSFTVPSAFISMPNGTLNEPGTRPERTPGRGSAASPRKRSALR